MTTDDVMNAIGLYQQMHRDARTVTGAEIATTIVPAIIDPDIFETITAQTLGCLKELVGRGSLTGVVDLRNAHATVIDLSGSA